ncbi:MFS transporter [Roseobacter cerasinus]|uniref:MFS transporter n=1 Tax=Roseobacter cerasinus TaxID=2602289 RepID=A0A640VX84_9RHOB|nr:MFS transporter [Roseobacter cerasinus]GFE51701.1 MFS transporter [Roseobacter cerasinus]
MISDPYRQLGLFLLLLFFGTVCAAMIVPYMGFFLVEGLNQDPWVISVYSALAICLTVAANRLFARRIDAGGRVHPLIGVALAGYLLASLAITLAPTLWMVLSLGVLGFGISSSAVSTMFSLGGRMAERADVDRTRFNAYMRATTSTAWMIGPAASFLVADRMGVTSVFHLGLLAALLWLALWWCALPRDITAEPKPPSRDDAETDTARHALWFAAAFVFCLSTAHSMTFTALPLFYVREVGLPGYAPGLAFSVKTFVEVLVIFSTPFVIAHIGLRRALLGTTLLAVVTIQLLAHVQTFGQMLAGGALEGLYYGLYASLGISYIQSFAPRRPAMATAVYWNTLMVSGLLAGPAVGLIAQSYSFQTVIYVASAVALCAAVILAGATRRARQAA